MPEGHMAARHLQAGMLVGSKPELGGSFAPCPHAARSSFLRRGHSHRLAQFAGDSATGNLASNPGVKRLRLDPTCGQRERAHQVLGRRQAPFAGDMPLCSPSSRVSTTHLRFRSVFATSFRAHQVLGRTNRLRVGRPPRWLPEVLRGIGGTELREAGGCCWPLLSGSRRPAQSRSPRRSAELVRCRSESKECMFRSLAISPPARRAR